MKKKILYLSTSLYPSGQAYSTRLVNFARIFSLLDMDVHIITDFTYEKFSCSSEINTFENCTYQIVSGKPTSFKRIVSTFKSIGIIKDYINNNMIDYVIIGNCYDRFNKIRDYCNRRSIPLILEICEWYDTKTRKFGNFNPYNIIYNKCMDRYYKKADGIIAISQYLHRYFYTYNSNVIKIPTILDVQNSDYNTRPENNKIVLVHFGLAALKKERFQSILNALALLGDKKSYFRYDIYGCSQKTVLKNIDNDYKLLNSLSDCVFIHGRVSQNEANNIYKNTDYSIFMRPQKRSSDAGFPTKLAESMLAATPVITNKTSDISQYIENDVNGFLIDDKSEDIKSVLLKILEMSVLEKEQMREKARRTAENCFDYRVYTNSLSEFFDLIK